MSVRARPTNRFQDSPKGRQPVSMESDLARAFTHTLTTDRSEEVDRQRATSILAAGRESRFVRPSVGGCAPCITAPAKYKLFKNQEAVPCPQAERSNTALSSRAR